MGYQEDYDFQRTPAFREQLEIAMKKIAIDIVGEVGTGVLRDKRHDTALNVLNGDFDIELWAKAAVADSAMTVTDLRNNAAFNTRLSAIWNSMSGVKSGD